MAGNKPSKSTTRDARAVDGGPLLVWKRNGPNGWSPVRRSVGSTTGGARDADGDVPAKPRIESEMTKTAMPMILVPAKTMEVAWNLALADYPGEDAGELGVAGARSCELLCGHL